MAPDPEETPDFSPFSKMRRIELDPESVIGRELHDRFAEFDESFTGHSWIWAVVVKLIGLTAMCSKAVIDLEKQVIELRREGAIPRQGVIAGHTGHFTGMEQIAEAVAIDGFGELADVIRAARSRAGTASDALTRIAHVYLDFARDNPAVYDAMFTRATTLRFAAQDTPPQLTAAFAELRQAVGVVADKHDADALE